MTALVYLNCQQNISSYRGIRVNTTSITWKKPTKEVKFFLVVNRISAVDLGGSLHLKDTDCLPDPTTMTRKQIDGKENRRRFRSVYNRRVHPISFIVAFDKIWFRNSQEISFSAIKHLIKEKIRVFDKFEFKKLSLTKTVQSVYPLKKM